MTAQEAAQKLRDMFPDRAGSPSEFRGEISLEVDRHVIERICLAAKQELGFDYLVDITSVDHLGAPPAAQGRFEVVYELYSYKHRIHLRLKVRVPEDNPRIPSVTSVWRTADWHEREIFDMMGLTFEGHPDLRRILMWDGYPYHPLKKDFPLEGKPSNAPGMAFTETAPLEGGPFVAVPGPHVSDREPRSTPRNPPPMP